MTLMGIVSNLTGLIICRVFLGMLEAGYFPGVSFYLTLWYLPYPFFGTCKCSLSGTADRNMLCVLRFSFLWLLLRVRLVDYSPTESDL